MWLGLWLAVLHYRDFGFGLDHPVHGGYGRGSPTPRRRSNCQTKKLKSGYGPNWGPGTKTNWPTDRRSQCNLKLNLRHWTANYRPVLPSERAPFMANKESHSNNWSLAPKGAGHQDELADWPSIVMWLRLRPSASRVMIYNGQKFKLKMQPSWKTQSDSIERERERDSSRESNSFVEVNRELLWLRHGDCLGNEKKGNICR
jgi:hypothetical protein